MTTPITPPLPINALITIQPVMTTMAGRDASGAQNLLALMADGSRLEYDRNRELVSNAIELAARYGAHVEAELDDLAA